MRKSIAAVALLISMSGANAGFFDGNKLYDACSDSRPMISGYVAGAFGQAQSDQGALFSLYLQAIESGQKSNPKVEKSFSDNASYISNYCVPKDIILKQAVDIFCQYLAASPGERHLAGEFLLNKALAKVWVCKP